MSSIGSAPPPPTPDASGQAQAEGTAGGSHEAFTPGPWEVVRREIPHHWGGSHVESQIVTSWDHPQMRGPLVVVGLAIGVGAELGGKAVTFTHIKPADANLLAAAPDLLEALRALETLFAPLARDSTQADWIDRARAAIRKATAP